MTHDEIIEMGRQATNNEPIYCRQEFTFSAKQLQAFANLVAAKEREACAKVVDAMADQMVEDMEPSTAIAWVRSKAAEIRARGNT